MRNKLLFLLLGLFMGQVFPLFSQEIPDVLKQRDEVYFTFNIHDRSELSTLTRIISIDNVKDHQVWAYANTKEFLGFMKLGYEITLLPSPGVVPGFKMKEPGTLAPLTVWNYYPTYTEYESLMAGFQTAHPTICNLDTIGTLASGRRLLVLKISDNVNTDETEPEFFYTSSIHGDETTGYILMMHLADYLLSNYGTNTEVTDLVNNMEIFINPLANPDGTYYGGNSSVNNARRYNINGVDLNRNYPDFQDGDHPDGNAWQPETILFMNYGAQRHFVASANFHGGVEVVNYPWDTWATLNADDAWWIYISRQYADTVHLHSTGYMTYLNNGITNGYAWYEVNGGRQDWMNYYQHCREMTIELSNTKLLPTSQLLNLWEYNWRSLINLMKEARYGIHGIITDQATGLPVAAKVFITGHDVNNTEVYSSANLGDYHRPIKAGTWTVQVSASCYQTQTISNVVVADHATVNLNIQLVPGPSAAVTTSSVTAITGSGATCGGNVTCTGQTAVTARGVCWSTTANPVVTGNHTTDGSGPGTFTSSITGLSTSSTYHVRAYATNTSGTYYGNDLTFTTTCGTVTTFPYTQGFENAGAIPTCWTQEQVNSSGVNWTFTTGNGGSYPSTAHGGTYNALLKDATAADNKTRLISPPLDLTGVLNPQVKFWHYQALWSGDQDQLAVYYKTSSGGTWTLITSYTASVTTWTQRTLTLPNPSSTYFIGFEGNAKYGYGVCLDDVEVSTSCTTTYPVSLSITRSANPVCAGAQVTFTATPVNGGAMPAYQWKVNAVNAVNATNAIYSYAPVNNDVVTCVLTSNLSCATGNPATSNSLTMNVTPNLPVSVSIVASANPVLSGTSVTFNTTPVNGGSTPSYQWKVNGANQGSGEPTFSYVPSDNDQVTCLMTSNATCTSGNPATSNIISMTVQTLPVILPVAGISITGTQCFDALQTIQVAGEGTYFNVQTGGMATLIAGQNILFYPGTTVLPGGYLIGYIAPSGPWCQLTDVAMGIGADDGKSRETFSLLFHPNPTTGDFTVSKELAIPDKTRMEIYSMNGIRIVSTRLNAQDPLHFSLTGYPAGIYLVRVISPEKTITGRIVKIN